uniref:Uncharacterized protein n=1 Tax=Castor canadensis TaxID=51338 RepID=A0A8C0ZYX0_CASCN
WPQFSNPKRQTWEEVSHTAEKLCLTDPRKEYSVYQEVNKIEKFHSPLMSVMAAKKSHSVTTELRC